MRFPCLPFNSLNTTTSDFFWIDLVEYRHSTDATDDVYRSILYVYNILSIIKEVSKVIDTTMKPFRTLTTVNHYVPSYVVDSR